MLGSRKLGRLLEHAQHAQAKVVLVGDDRQLAAIDAGGGFRALRLRFGASELVENRRQHQAWEREALELVRSGLVEDAVAAYQAHDRVVAADSKPAATLALLQDWWAAYQEAEGDLGPGGRGVGRPPGRGGPAQHRLPGAAGRPRSPRPRAAAGRGPPAGRRRPGRLWPQRDRRAGGGQRQPRHHLRPRPPGPDLDDPPGWHRRPGGRPAPVLSGWPRPRGAQPAGGPGLCHHRPPRPGLDPGTGPGPAHRHRRRELAVCTAVSGPTGHPPVRGGRPRAAGRRGAGPPRPGAARRLPAACPGAVAGRRPDPGHRHPQQPRSPTNVDR